MKYTIPTLEHCLKITENNDSFYMTTNVVEGIKTVTFNYRLASYNDFVKPLIDCDNIDAFEIRGLTFVEYPDGFKRYLMLRKFFNLGQTIGYMYDDVKDKKIVRVQDKLDGSMIRFVQLPSGEIVAKTKMGFTNEQAIMAQKIHDKNHLIQNLVRDTLNNGLAAIFELISPYNRIVIDYSTSELRLLQVRDEETGEYDLNIDQWVSNYGVRAADCDKEVISLDDYISLAEKEHGFEGWVITMSDGQMLKLKTKWYCELHHLLTESLNKENHILIAILNENIDDAIAQIPDENEMKNKIIELTQVMNSFCNSQLSEIVKILSENVLTQENRKDFALKYKSHYYFGVLMKCYRGDWNEEMGTKQFRDFIQRKIEKLSDAQHFVKNVLHIDFRAKEYEDG